MNKKNTNKRAVTLNLIQGLPRLSWLLSLQNSVRGRSRIKYGMTPNFNNSAFTLIELLVVVLIIGILAAVAVPQYQKAVLKSRMMETLVLGRTMLQAQQAYRLANGTYASDLDELGVDFSNALDKYQFTLTKTHCQIFHTSNSWFWDIYYDSPFLCAAHVNKSLENSVCASITNNNSPHLANTVWNYYTMR